MMLGAHRAQKCAGQKKLSDACVAEAQKALKGIKGVETVALDAANKSANLTFAKDAEVTTTAIAQALKKSEFKFTVRFSK